MTRAVLTGCLLAATACLACSDDQPLTINPICVSLNPASLAASPFALRTGPGSSCNKLVVDIVANEAAVDVYSMNLEFRYPLIVGLSFQAGFSPPEAGEIWDADGAPILPPLFQEVQPGIVTLGISRQSPSPALNVPAGTVLARLAFFQAVTSGSGIITFLDGSLLDDSMPPVVLGSEITADTTAGQVLIGQ